MAMMKNELNLPLILTVGAISVLLLVMSGIGTEAWFLNEEHYELQSKWDNSHNTTLEAIRAEQSAKLHGYRWADGTKQRAVVPIDEAMELLIQNKGVLPTTQPGTAAPASQPAASADDRHAGN